MDEWGVESRYLDSADVERVVAADSVRAVRELVGRAPVDLDATAPLVVRTGTALGVRGEVLLESGDTVPVGTDTTDLPLGYHLLDGGNGTRRTLIVTPGRCVTPARRAWGWAVQLYAARSERSWGFGTMADLRTVADWATRAGAGFVLLNPVNAAALAAPQEASPYFPSTRRFRNPLYLQVDDIPGAADVDISAAARAGHALNAGALLDRDEVWRISRPALEAVHAAGVAEDFAAWRQAGGRALQDFATWCALADRYGPQWRSWPVGLRRPDCAAVAEFAAADADTVGFHAWLQFELARQLDRAAEHTMLVQDFPVGFDPQGFDAWAWQDLVAFDATIGCPPDPFNLAGQDWGLPPFVPWRLRQAGYGPFIESIRANMAVGGGLRIDHVMGLFRLWWIPSGSGATDGAYVRYPARELLDIVALESVRAGAVVIGEDLGTVEDGVRETMQAAGMLTYRLLWFEQDEPAEWPATSMGAVTTHDLPTVAGLWSGVDLADQHEAGVPAADEATAELRAKLAAAGGIADDVPAPEAVDAAYRALSAAPCTLLTASLDDAFGMRRRPNMPGTSTRPNWSLPLPAPLEQLDALPEADSIAATLGAAVRAQPDAQI